MTGNKKEAQPTAGWAADAHKVIAALPDEAVRPLLVDYYEQTASSLERERGFSRQDAEQQAFGLLLFQILRCGIDAPASNPNKWTPT